MVCPSFWHSMQVSSTGKNIAPKTDVQVADAAGHVAVQLLIERWNKDPSNEQNLLSAVLCARRVAEKCPIGCETNFFLAHVYRVIGESPLRTDAETPLD